MTRRERKYAAIGALAFATVAAACIAWYAAFPGDQVILLALLAFPADCLFFAPLILMRAEPPSLAAQTAAVVLLGVLQWGIVGFGVASLVDQPEDTKDD